MIRSTVALAVLTISLAGCISGEPLVDGAVGGAAGEGVVEDPTSLLAPAVNLTRMKEEGVEAPRWETGLAFTMQGQGDGASETCTFVVVAATASDYTFATTCQSVAEYDALFDVSFVGRIRASDLAGSQQDQPVQFFSWPLTDGKSWTTVWDGQRVTLTATFASSIMTPAGTHPGFTIVGVRESGDVHVTYDYVPALRWWSHVSFGEYTSRVEKVETSWSGTYYVGQSQQLLHLGPVAPGLLTPAGSFTVSPDQTSLYVISHGYGEAHARAVQLVTPEGPATGSGATAISGGAGGWWQMDRYEPTPGQWHVLSLTATDPEGFAMVMAYEVAILERALAPAA